MNPPRITLDTYTKVFTTFNNRVWQVEGEMKKRVGLNLTFVSSDTEVIKHWRTTKNGKSRLYLVIW